MWQCDIKITDIVMNASQTFEITVERKSPQAGLLLDELCSLPNDSRCPENVQLIMKLIIRPASELGNRVFTSSDVVTGLIYLEINDSLSISEIQFSIQGR